MLVFFGLGCCWVFSKPAQAREHGSLGKGGNTVSCKVGQVIYCCVKSEVLELPQSCGIGSIREEC